jgi:hypothetical protein
MNQGVATTDSPEFTAVKLGSKNVRASNTGLKLGTDLGEIGEVLWLHFDTVNSILYGDPHFANPVNGSTLTNLDASQLLSGTVPLARLPGTVLTNGQPAASLSGTTTLTNVVVNGAQTNKGSLTVHGGGNVETNTGWRLAEVINRSVQTIPISNGTFVTYCGSSTDNSDYNGGGQFTWPYDAGITSRAVRVRVHTRQDTTTNEIKFYVSHDFINDTGGSESETYLKQFTWPVTNAFSMWVYWTNTWSNARNPATGSLTINRMQCSATGTIWFSSMEYRNLLLP